LSRKAQHHHEDVDTVGYSRVSKGEQAAEWKSSLRQQTDGITRLAEQLGRLLRPEHIHEDRFSGEDAEDRPGFMALVAFCRANPRPRSRQGVALFLNDSRFGRFRNPDEAAHWRFELAKCGWIVRFVENDETEHPTTRHVMRALGGAQASEYLANLRANSKRGARGAAEAGLWQNEAPFGYRRQATAPGREPVVLEVGQRKSDDQQVRLTPGPEEEVALLRWMFETYAGGLLSLGQLTAEMRRKAARLKWSKANVAKMLANEAYLGHVIWCRRPHDKHERREVKVRPKKDWVITRNAHPPLVTQELFDRVQRRLALNRKRTRAANGAYPLSGLIRCTHCGYPYVGGGGNRGPAGDEDRYRFYRCSGSHDDRKVCPGRIGTIKKRAVEPIIIGLVSDVVSAPHVQQLIREEVESYLASLHGSSAGEKTALVGRRDTLASEKKRVVGAIARGVLNDQDARAEMERINGALADIERSLARLNAMTALELNLKREAERLVGLAKDFRARAAELKGPALHELLKPWIEEATFDKETRVLDLTIRQVPQLDSEVTLASEQLQPDVHAVRAQVTFPGLERDAEGRYRTPSYKIPVVLSIQTPDGKRVERRSVDQYRGSHAA
jgi:DNA invertase Pin-like site-specific DNA recombinase